MIPSAIVLGLFAGALGAGSAREDNEAVYSVLLGSVVAVAGVSVGVIMIQSGEDSRAKWQDWEDAHPQTKVGDGDLSLRLLVASHHRLSPAIVFSHYF